ncbi:hypothetical protein KBX71_11065 [Micromonospora sp. D93]|uniref:hypothetical protein n=1 Tax=Micromonospora sp. D93 TaxID=2824886 RepID=UPI001B368788|nr:hypothetical protein [Micromonospora sp. D93]MBQ1018398.1 hypothetical protein [Micromonospora sp. D93]
MGRTAKRVAAVAAAALAFGAVPTTPASADTVTNGNDVCVYDWGDTAFWVDCQGDGQFKATVDCDWGFQHDSGWTNIPGSWRYECTWGVISGWVEMQ